MIASQRKAHKIVWLLLTLFMVAFLFLTVPQLNFSTSEQDPSKETVLVTQRNNQVMVSVNKPLKSASSLIYELTEKGERGRYLGQIRGTGLYAYTIGSTAHGLIIIDRIKNEELFKTTF